jgi:phosphoribosyl 1,2-cyclic phosphate phosphodiesterase
MKVTVLGCGGSGGVPMIGGYWGACNPANPKNRRRRASVLVEAQGQAILIDCGPDLREQMNDAGVRNLDAVLLTHTHSDHVQGIDDLRKLFLLNGGRPVGFYAAEKDMEIMQKRFAYSFQPFAYEAAKVDPFVRHIIDGPFAVGEVEIVPFSQDHGHVNSTTLGFRIGDFAYTTDAKSLDENAFKVLAGVKVWVVDCIREAAHPAHSHLDQTLGWIARVKPQKAYFTHMDATFDYDAALAKSPTGVWPAYDGLVIEL